MDPIRGAFYGKWLCAGRREMGKQKRRSEKRFGVKRPAALGRALALEGPVF